MNRFFCRAVLCIPLLLACRQGQEGGKAQPPPEGKAFLRYISKDNPYTGWPLWPGKGEKHPGTEPHGAYLTTYVNEQALQAIRRKSGMPNGAIIVEENYKPDKELDSVTAMYKKQGFSPQAGDWFWIKVSAEGRIESEGRVAGCISCHAKARANDFLFAASIPPP